MRSYRCDDTPAVAIRQYPCGVDQKERGERLRAYLQDRLSRAGASSVTNLATIAGARGNTLSEWWTVGKEPDLDSLRRLARALRVPVFELVAAYEGEADTLNAAREAAVEAAAERGAQRALARAAEQP